MIRKFYLTLILLLQLAVCTVANSAASTHSHHIEMLLFMAKNPQDSSEDLAKEKDSFVDSRNIQTIAAEKIFASNQYLLSKEVEKLNKQTSGYNIISHVAFGFDLINNKLSPLIKVPDMPSNLSALIKVKPSNNNYQVIIQAKFSPENTQEEYVLDSKAKFKSKDIYYFDHPKFGILMHIRPLSNLIEEDLEEQQLSASEIAEDSELQPMSAELAALSENNV